MFVWEVVVALERLMFTSLFLVQSPAQYGQIEEDAVRLSEEIKAEYWAVSALLGQ